MKYDAFDAGIDPGGLRSTHEIMVLICHLINQTGHPLPKQLIIEMMQRQAIANYFDVAQSLTQLMENGCLDSGTDKGEETVSLTEQGESAMLALRDILPKSVREKAEEGIRRLLTRRRNEEENRVEILKSDGRVSVVCTVLDQDTELLRVSLMVGDVSQAEEIKQVFLDNPARLYKSVLEALSEDLQS